MGINELIIPYYNNFIVLSNIKKNLYLKNLFEEDLVRTIVCHLY